MTPKIAILTRNEFRSPKYLAYGLKKMLTSLGYKADVYEDGCSLLQTIKPKDTSIKTSIQNHWIAYKLRKFANYDLIVISDTMQAFREVMNIDAIRHLGKPLIHYEVFFMGGCKYWIDRLPNNALEKYDSYWVVSGIHDDERLCNKKPHSIGLRLLETPQQASLQKNKFVALLDFARDGYEEYREIQLEALNTLNIDTIVLDKEYTFSEIADEFKKVSIAFIAFPEAFGVPIVQLQYQGSKIFSPQKSWVKRHALLDDGEVFSDNDSTFTSNFVFYDNLDDLVIKLKNERHKHSPNIIRQTLLQNQPDFVDGDLNKLKNAIEECLETFSVN